MTYNTTDGALTTNSISRTDLFQQGQGALTCTNGEDVISEPFYVRDKPHGKCLVK